MTLTIGSLFSGVGGLELGLEMAGLGPVVFQAEVDPFCRAVLAKHWPNATRYNDVRDVDERSPKVDLVCGGFPCTDISNAGKRAGIGEKESSSWPTPDAGVFNDGQTVEAWANRKEREFAKNYNGNGGGTPLAMAVKLWPTATAGDAKSSGSRNLEGSEAHAGVSLTDAVLFGNSETPRREWATPLSRDCRGPTMGRNAEGSAPLSQQVTWATPTTQDGANNGGPSQMERNSLPLNAQVKGRLNPDWVEALVGLPIGWTRIDGPLPPESPSTNGNRRGSSKGAPPTAPPDCER